MTYSKFLFLPFLFFAFISLNSNAQSLPDNLEQKLKQMKSSNDRIRYINGIFEEPYVNYSIIEKTLNIASDFAQKEKDTELEKEIRFLNATRFTFFEKDAQKRIETFEGLINKYENDRLYKAICFHQIGQNQFILEQYGESFKNSLKAQKIFDEIGYEKVPNMGKYLHDLSLNYYFFKNYSEAIDLMRISTRLPKFNENLDIQRYNTLGLSFLNLEELDSANYYLNIGLKKAKTYKNEVWIGLISGNIGKVLLKKKDYPNALIYFKNNYELNKNRSEYPEIPQNACVSLANAYLESDSLDQAFLYIQIAEKKYFQHKENFQFGEQQQFEVAKKGHYENNYLYHLKKNNYKEALLYKDSLDAAQKYGNTKYNSAIVKISQDQLRISEIQNTIARQQKEKSEMKFRYSASVSILLLLLCSILTLLFFTRRKKKKEKEMFLINQRIAELERLKTEEDLVRAKQQIGNFVKRIKRNDDMMGKMTEELEKIKLEYSLEQKELNATLNELRSTKILTEDDWSLFQSSFDKIHPNFISNVRDSFPKITPSELRYLMLTKLDLNHKEMANALGVSPSTIRVTWNRVRNKLNGNLEDTPISLLAKIENR